MKIKCFMIRRLVPVLMILVAVASLGSLFYITVPRTSASTYIAMSTLTAVVPEILLDYSTSTVSCTGVTPVCFVQVYPYTYTETWSAQTTPILLRFTTSTSHVALVNSGSIGDVAVLCMLFLLVGGIALVTRDIRRKRSGTS
jgi:hypothetical protein